MHTNIIARKIKIIYRFVEGGNIISMLFAYSPPIQISTPAPSTIASDPFTPTSVSIAAPHHIPRQKRKRTSF
jgi:hypothetical protein